MQASLCMDLVLMIRYPFKQKESRVRVYLIVTFCFCAINFVYMVIFAKKTEDGYHLNILFLTLEIVLYVFYAGVFIFSIVYACRKLNSHGMSTEVRQLVLTRHISSQVVFFICNAYMIACLMIWFLPEWRDNYQEKELDTWWTRTLKLIYVTQGFFIPVLRFREPFFNQVAKRELSKLLKKFNFAEEKAIE